ncbi:hypothetical protein D9758_017808 [Tetrapyrgos nigripes]|uniref:Uncharacterized protein n=1 Tax=Tetrapyrgos nigripes TaxID=182062 RepID=A0A8H5B6V6_9AGAR|nr:hypothetical protein D9758_017808 [Tetrapyrgos nigripes]
MSTSLLRAPRAPTEHLCLESTKFLAKLQLIAEFKHWLDHTRDCLHRNEPSFKILFDCFAVGASLGVLLDLPGSPAPSHLSVDVETSDFQLGMPDREKFFANFTQRVHFLEIQGKPRYGEVLRIEDLFGGTSSGFMKVLKTVQRLLDALQATYPSLCMFSRPNFLLSMTGLILVCTLFAFDAWNCPTYLNSGVFGDKRQLVVNAPVSRPCLKDMEAMLLRMERSDFNGDAEDWLHIFGFDNPANRTNIAATYHSLSSRRVLQGISESFSTSYPSSQLALQITALGCRQSYIALYLHSQSFQSRLFLHLQAAFDTVCTTLYHMSQISSAIDKMSWQIRSIQALRTLNQRAFHWNASIDLSQLGNLLVDDQLKIYDADSGTGLKPKPKDEAGQNISSLPISKQCCCVVWGNKKLQKHRRNGSGSGSRSTRKGDVELDPHAQKTGTAYSTWASWTEWTRNGLVVMGRQRRDLEDGNGQGVEMRSQQQQNGNGSAKTNAARNPEHDPGSRQNIPIRSWELGSALRKKTPLNLIYAIPTAWMKVLSVDEELFSLDWRDNEGGGEKYALKLSYPSIDQSDQWLLVLEGFVTEVVDVFADEHLSNQLRESLDGSSIYEIGTDIFNLDDDGFYIPGRRYSRPRPWSLIGPKGPYSDPSSMYQQKSFEPTELLLCPDMLPELFCPKSHRPAISA